MVNTELLRHKIDESGLKITFICEKLNITPQAFYKRLDSKSDWSFTQVMTLKGLLRLDDSDVNDIFFNDDAE